MTTLEPPDRDIAMVFQSYALYPHKTVRENLAFGLRRRKVPKEEIAERVDRMAAMLGLGELMERKPAALSGGQRQRVAMGRALVREPRAFLMDEPLSNLDAKLRTSMRGELARLHERLPTTTVYVTHDQVEAMTLGQRVAVLRDGVIQQCDVPQRLFDHPANLFVGAFIGSPAMNLVEAHLDGEHGQLRRPASCGSRAPTAVGEREVVLGAAADELRASPGPGAIRAGRGCGSSSTWSSSSARSATCCSRVDAPPVATDDVKAAIGGESGADEGRLLADDRRARFTARIQGRPPASAGGRSSSRSTRRRCTSSIARAAARWTRADGGESGMRPEREEASMTEPAKRALVAAPCSCRALVLRAARAAGAAAASTPVAPPPANASFDYQIGGDYPLPAGVSVVSRDWFSGDAAADPAYSICYVNAFQTQADEAGRRPPRRAAPTGRRPRPQRARRRPALGRRVPGRHQQREQAPARGRLGRSR